MLLSAGLELTHACDQPQVDEHCKIAVSFWIQFESAVAGAWIASRARQPGPAFAIIMRITEEEAHISKNAINATARLQLAPPLDSQSCQHLTTVFRRLLKRRQLVKPEDLVIVVSDVRYSEKSAIRSVQIRQVP